MSHFFFPFLPFPSLHISRDYLFCFAGSKSNKDGKKSKDDDDDDDDEDDKKKDAKKWFGRKRAESLANSEADTFGKFLSTLSSPVSISISISV